LQVSLIEYTLKHSALGDLKKGSRVNIETDIIGKYIKRLAIPYTGV
jgi:riboflavin synthase